MTTAEAFSGFIFMGPVIRAETLFPELLECRSSKTLNLYPTMAIHVPAYFHTIMQRGRTGNITLHGTATTTVDIYTRGGKALRHIYSIDLL